MAKKKKLKQKTTGFDIMYRVVSAVLAVAMYPALYFSTLLYYEIDHSGLSAILEKLTGKEDPGFTYGEISIAEVVNGEGFFATLGEGNLSFDTILSNPIFVPVIVAAVFLAVALVLGLVILGFAVFSNKSKVILALSGTGILMMIGSYVSFTSFFAKKVLSGEISVTEIFNPGGSILTSLLGMAGKISSFHLDSAFFAVAFLMLGIFIWSLAVIIVNHSDEKEKANA